MGYYIYRHIQQFVGVISIYFQSPAHSVWLLYRRLTLGLVARRKKERKKMDQWFEARSSAPADKESCCLHFAFSSLSFRPSSLKESEFCYCSAPCFKTVNSCRLFFYGSGNNAGPQPTVQHTMSTNLNLLYSTFCLADIGGYGDFLMDYGDFLMVEVSRIGGIN